MNDRKRPHCIDLPSRRDDRGMLSIVESSKLLDFEIKRVYYLYGQDAEVNRGAHAHKTLRQMMICMSGHAEISVEGAFGKEIFVLASPQHGLLMPSGCWRDLKLSDQAIVVVLASADYDENDYIRSHADFTIWLKEQNDKAASIPYIALDRCHAELAPSIKHTLGDVFERGIFIGGPALATFEAAFASYCGVRHAVGCANGLDALSLLLEAYGIGHGDEVIVPNNSFIASALAVEKVGARTVLVDCDPLTYGLAVSQLEAARTERTRAVMPVHLYGIPAEMDAVNSFAKRYGLIVIEDAAQAHGATYKGRRVGSLGHAAAFSFYPTKNLGALGDGGAIVTDDPAIAEKARMLSNYGSKVKYQHEFKGSNSRLDPMQAAVLSCKLPHLDIWNQRRRDLATIYYEALSGIDSIQLASLPDYLNSVWHVFPLRVLQGSRDRLITYLAQNNIGTNIHYPCTIGNSPAYNRPERYPQSEQIVQQVLSLPLDPYHTDLEIRSVAEAVKNWAETIRLAA